MSEKMTFPTYDEWIEDPEITADKLLALTAVSVVAVDHDLTDAEAYYYLRSLVGDAARMFGYEVSKRKV